MIGGKLYTNRMLADPATLTGLGFNSREARFLAQHPWYELESLYLRPYVDKLEDPYHPFGSGLDDLDKIPITEIYTKAGASQAAINFFGEEQTSALFRIWTLAAMRSRRIPPSEGEMFRLQGGNEQLPIAFARRLGTRVKLAHPITAIRQSDQGVSVSYREYGYGETRTMDADFFVNCISLTVFSGIPITPALSPAKQYVVDNLTYSSHPFYVFEASSRFWLADGLRSINMEFDHPEISSIWEVPTETADDAGPSEGLWSREGFRRSECWLHFGRYTRANGTRSCRHSPGTGPRIRWRPTVKWSRFRWGRCTSSGRRSCGPREESILRERMPICSAAAWSRAFGRRNEWRGRSGKRERSL